MTVSRIDKFLCVRAKTASVAEAHSFRDHAIEIAVACGASSHLVRPAIALALRCFTGAVHVLAEDGGDSDVMRAARDEARAYGADDRLRIDGGPPECIRFGVSKMVDGVFVDAAGAVASVNKLSTMRAAPWPPAAAFAVACGFGKLFARMSAASRDVQEEQWDYSLLTLSATALEARPISENLDIGRVLLIGAGAIGSAFAFVLKRSGWRCELLIADPQPFEEPNHETTLLISQNDALTRLPKAKTLAALASGGAVAADSLEEYVGPGHAVLRRQDDRADAGLAVAPPLLLELVELRFHATRERVSAPRSVDLADEIREPVGAREDVFVGCCDRRRRHSCSKHLRGGELRQVVACDSPLGVRPPADRVVGKRLPGEDDVELPTRDLLGDRQEKVDGVGEGAHLEEGLDQKVLLARTGCGLGCTAGYARLPTRTSGSLYARKRQSAPAFVEPICCSAQWRMPSMRCARPR